MLDRKVELREVDDDGFPIGTSEYGITNANIARIVYGDEKHKVRIPSNLSIIGTMNTSDQNVFTLDTAFQRRWDMRLIENNFENVDPSLADATILDTSITWKDFCTEINKIVVGNGVRMTSAEDKRLGAYFLHLRDLKFDENMGDLADGEYDALRKKESHKQLTDTEKARLTEIRDAMKQNRKFPEKVSSICGMMLSNLIERLYLRQQSTKVWNRLFEHLCMLKNLIDLRCLRRM